MQVKTILNTAKRLTTLRSSAASTLVSTGKPPVSLSRGAEQAEQSFLKRIGKFFKPKNLFSEQIIWVQKISQRFSFHSKNPEIAQIEKSLAKKKVFVRFRNNLEMAKIVQQSLEKVEKAGFKLPRQIFFFKFNPDIGRLGFVQAYKMEMPVFLSDNSHNYFPFKGVSSTRNKDHTVMHELGHYLHYQKVPATLMSGKSWKAADKNIVRREVSLNATKDGREFVAEVFAGLMSGKTYSSYIMDIYTKLKGPMPKLNSSVGNSLSLAA